MSLNEYAQMQGRKSILYSSETGINDSIVSKQQPTNEQIRIIQSPKDRINSVEGKKSIKVNDAFWASRNGSISDYLCGSLDIESRLKQSRLSERSMVDGRTSTEPTRILKSSQWYQRSSMNQSQNMSLRMSNNTAFGNLTRQSDWLVPLKKLALKEKL